MMVTLLAVIQFSYLLIFPPLPQSSFFSHFLHYKQSLFEQQKQPVSSSSRDSTFMNQRALYINIVPLHLRELSYIFKHSFWVLSGRLSIVVKRRGRMEGQSGHVRPTQLAFPLDCD